MRELGRDWLRGVGVTVPLTLYNYPSHPPTPIPCAAVFLLPLSSGLPSLLSTTHPPRAAMPLLALTGTLVCRPLWMRPSLVTRRATQTRTWEPPSASSATTRAASPSVRLTHTRRPVLSWLGEGALLSTLCIGGTAASLRCTARRMPHRDLWLPPPPSSSPLAAGASSAVVAFAGGTFVVSSGAVICLLIITVAVSEKSRKLLGFLRKCVPPDLPLLDRHLQHFALNCYDLQC